MSFLCTNCNINWAQLKTLYEGDEDYNMCPECNTDEYLQESNDPETYVKSPLNGKVINTKTKKEREAPHYEPPADPPYYKYKKRKFLTIPLRNV